MTGPTIQVALYQTSEGIRVVLDVGGQKSRMTPAEARDIAASLCEAATKLEARRAMAS